MNYTSFTQSNLFADLDDLDAWLTERGITKRNRLRVYRKNLIEMRDLGHVVDAAEVFANIRKAGRINEIISSYVDGFEIVDSLMALRAGNVPIPDKLLSRALEGSPDASRESTKNNQGRNAMFELSVGAVLARDGLMPAFCTDNPDVEFQFEGRRILVECKRVLSKNGTLGAISEGIRQLRTKVSLSEQELGIVAVSISRLFNRGDGWWDVSANADVRLILSEMIAQHIASIDQAILRKRHVAATGALFYAVAPFRIEGLGYVPVRTGVFCPFEIERNEFLVRLASSIHL